MHENNFEAEVEQFRALPSANYWMPHRDIITTPCHDNISGTGRIVIQEFDSTRLGCLLARVPLTGFVYLQPQSVNEITPLPIALVDV